MMPDGKCLSLRWQLLGERFRWIISAAPVRQSAATSGCGIHCIGVLFSNSKPDRTKVGVAFGLIPAALFP